MFCRVSGTGDHRTKLGKDGEKDKGEIRNCKGKHERECVYVCMSVHLSVSTVHLCLCVRTDVCVCLCACVHALMRAFVRAQQRLVGCRQPETQPGRSNGSGAA